MRIPMAKKRIVIHAMDIRWGDHVIPFFDLFIAAAQRGVEVRIVGDIYSKLQARMPHRRRDNSMSWDYNQAISRQLQASGVHVSYTGTLGLNPFARRTHSKITLIDDDIFTFGGINFSDNAFSNADYMLGLHNQALADRLYVLVRSIEADKAIILPNLEESLGTEVTLLFDGGRPRDSIIYDTACRVIRSAKKVYYVSQMCPSGRLAQAIISTDNECYFIQPHQADPPANLALLFDTWRYKITNRYHGKTYIHAKFILAIDKDGSKHIISGSNNFSWRGVAYGTKEIAIHSTDEQLWDTFYNYLRQHIAN